MHHKKSEVHQIRKLETTSISSSSYNQQHQIPLPHIQPNPNPNTKQQHNQTQQHTHLRIQIPSLKDPNFQHEPISKNPPTPQKPILSTPHKRTLMTQSPIHHHPFAQNPTKYNHHQQNLRKPNLFSFCSNLVSIPFLTKSLASRVCCHVCRARIYGIHLRFIVLLILPTLYFFASNTNLSFFLEFICVVAFSIALLTSLNLALPRLPSIKLFLSRSLPSKFTSLACGGTKSHSPPPPVVWSIGSKPKTEKKLNSGFGVQVYTNGDVYEGEFHRGKCSGSGVYYYYRSGRYEGDWIDGKYDGYGVETWAKGSRYRGQYMQGLRHGVGVYRFYNGDVYAGEWSNGQSHGCGVHTCEDGSKYAGEFKWGVKHGLGHYHFRNGDTYAGEYFADKMHGFGVYQFGNGHRYEGAWHEGRRQGFGMYTFRNGERQCGHWQNGAVDIPSPRSIDAGSPSAIIHSKVITAVQEAQQASRRASEVGKIDDRLNKAIAAANKSANAARVAAVKAVQDRMFQNTSGDDLPMAFV